MASKPVTRAEKVARLQDYYAPQAEVILREMRGDEERRFGTALTNRCVRDSNTAFARAFLGKLSLNDEMRPMRGLRAPLMVVYAIWKAAKDPELWTKWHREIQTLGKARATRNFCQSLCGAAGMSTFTEAVFQLLLEVAGFVRKMGPIGTTVLAGVGADVVYMFYSCLWGSGNVGQAMQSLMDNLTKSACGIAALGVLEVALPAVVIGVLIAIVCGFVVPAVYRQMDSKMTWRDFFTGLLEALRLKSPSPVEEYVTDGELGDLLFEHANDLLCPIGLVLMRHPVCLHGMAFEYQQIVKQVTETGRDALNDRPAALAELEPIPKLRALIDELVEEFDIETAEVLHCEC